MTRKSDRRCFLKTAAAAAETQPPNSIFILADDPGYGAVGSDRQVEMLTTHLDRMAAVAESVARARTPNSHDPEPRKKGDQQP